MRVLDGSFATYLRLLICGCWCMFSAITSANSDSQHNYYKLGPGDRIQITVFGEADLSLNTTLAEGGYINYPYLGMVKAEGLTISELESKLTSGLKGDYLINPSVHVSMVSYRPFYIHGQVKSPGSYPYQPKLTLEKALALAGGVTERASMGQISILRTVEGKEKRLKGELHTLIQPGDAIFIKDSFF